MHAVVQLPSAIGAPLKNPVLRQRFPNQAVTLWIVCLTHISGPLEYWTWKADIEALDYLGFTAQVGWALYQNFDHSFNAGSYGLGCRVSRRRGTRISSRKTNMKLERRASKYYYLLLRLLLCILFPSRARKVSMIRIKKMLDRTLTPKPRFHSAG